MRRGIEGVDGGVVGGKEAEERKEGSAEITRLGPCEVLQARHGGAEVAATAPKGSAAEERDVYGPVEATDAARRKVVKTSVPTQHFVRVAVGLRGKTKLA